MTEIISCSPLILKMEYWPHNDKAAWNALFIEGDIIDGAGPSVNWTEGSRIKRAQSYGTWLSFLSGIGKLGTGADVTDLVTKGTLQAFIKYEFKRCHMRTVYIHLVDIYALSKSMSPDKDWSWLREFLNRFRTQCNIGEIKPRENISAQEIFSWAFDTMRKAASEHRQGRIRPAVHFRDGLMLGLLISRPLRVRTFMCIELDRHLITTTGGFELRFQPSDVKDKKPHEYTIPQELIEPMQQYLTVYRPTLLKGKISNHLWITYYGTPYSIEGFKRQMPVVTKKAFGKELRPHSFRHIAATSIAINDPTHVNIIAPLLGHSSLAMSEKHYNRASSSEAAARYQDMVKNKRKEARSRIRNQQRIKNHGRGPSPYTPNVK